MKPNLPTVTLIIADCVEYDRARLSFDHCRAACNFGDAKLLTHFDAQDPNVVKIPQIKSIEEYSHFMIKDLANYFDTQHVLVAQWDGFVWKPELWDNKFLQYDYIGAPWPESLLFKGVPKHFNVGNGDFLLGAKGFKIFYEMTIILLCTGQKTWQYASSIGHTWKPRALRLLRLS